MQEPDHISGTASNWEGHQGSAQPTALPQQVSPLAHGAAHVSSSILSNSAVVFYTDCFVGGERLCVTIVTEH